MIAQASNEAARDARALAVLSLTDYVVDAGVAIKTWPWRSLACRMVTADRLFYEAFVSGPYGAHLLSVADPI